jgi:flagellin
MSVINTNVKALYTQAALKISGREGATAMQQLSTGKRINSAKDDAAGMAIADRMTQQIRSLNQAVRNAGDAISLIQTAEGATNEITDMLQRMRELAIQAINDTNSGDQRAYLDLEFQQLKQEIVRVSETTEWNGFPLLNGTGGVPQGEQPVYKVQSTPSVTTAANFSESVTTISEPIEQQLVTFTDAEPTVKTLTFTAPTIDGALAVSFDGMDDVNFLVGSSDTLAEVGAKAVSALNNNSDFVGLGRLAVDNGDGTIDVRFSADDADEDITLSVATATTDAALAYTSDSTTAGQETQVMTFTAGADPGALSITLAGQSDVVILVDAAESAADMGAKAVAALNADTEFLALGRVAVDNGDGTIDITFSVADGDVANSAGSTPTTDSAASTTATSGGGDITVGGVTVAVTAGDSAEVIATNVAEALNAATFVTANDGRLVVDNGDGTITVTYNVEDADVQDLSFVDTDETGTTMEVEVEAVTSASATFANAGKFLKSGELSLSIEPTQQEVQRVVFGPAAAASSVADPMVVAGVNITTIAVDDTASEVAAKVQAALIGNAAFGPDSGRTVTNNYDGSLTITFAPADGDVDAITFADASTPTGITASVFTTTNYASVSATYDVDDGDTVRLTGRVDSVNGEVIFAKESVAQVDTFTFDEGSTGFSTASGSTISLTVDDIVLTFNIEDVATVAEDLAAAINEDRNLSQIVSAELQRDGTMTLTALVPGQQFVAYATYARPDGDDATVSSETTTVNVDAGDNALVISDDMTISMTGADGLAEDITYRAPELTLSVGRSYQSLASISAGDLIINGVTVGPSYAEDDGVSQSHKAGGALAKAVAINRVKELTGVQAVVSEAVLTGTAMTPGVVVTGTLTINGYTSPVITTTLNDTRESRSTVVEAINRMTARTGVVAYDSGSDAKGVRLEAADGRNIEVFFNTASSNAMFARQTGLREGLTTGSIALESKVEAPIVITSTGNIDNAGFVVGDFSANHTAVAGSDRSIAQPAVAQIGSVDVTGTIAVGDEFSITLNGRTKTVTATTTSAKDVIDELVTAIQNDSAMAAAVSVSKGSRPSEIYFTSNTPGIEFTLTASTTADSGYVDVAEVRANADATNVKLNTGDIVINGIAIPGSRADGDIRSPHGILSGQPDSSGIAIAAAINSVADKTGVRAGVKPANMIGTATVTGAPGVYPETGIQSLYINGIEVEITLTEDEPSDTRRENVIASINRKLDSHGVLATNNGNGVTLTSSDGRNVSVWFDSSVPGLSPASFGLSTGDEVAQVSTITVSEGSTADTTATIEINGVSMTTSEVAGPSSASDIAAAIKSAVDTALNNGSLTNLSVSVFNGVVTVTSTIAGSGFTIAGADSSAGEVEMQIATTTQNSLGNSPVTGIWGGNVDSVGALTMYSGIELISDKEFTVSAGTNGYRDPSHWLNLGFTEGTFGGRSSIEMSPPRVGRMTFQVGATMNQSIHIDFADFGKDGIITGTITGDVELWDSDARVNRIDNRESAQDVLTKLDTVLDKVNGTRATMGAVMNRLEHVIDNLMNVSMNSEASRSQIEDADYAAASTELARTQIMQQAATSVLAQANADQQNVLKLLQ